MTSGTTAAAGRQQQAVGDDLAWLESAALQLRHAGTAHYPPGGVVGPRRIPDFELVWIGSGTAFYEDGQGRSLQLGPGDVVLVRPGERHRFVMERRRMLAHGFAHFTGPAAALRRLAAWPCGPVHATAGSELRLALTSCERLFATCSPNATAPRLALRHALALFHQATLGAGEPVWTRWPLDQRVGKVLAAVRAGWSERPAWTPGIAELVRLAGCSPATLGRAFRSALGVAPLEAIRLWRIERAALLLERGGTTVAAAAAQIGWRHPDVFARAFRASYGLSPRAAARRAAAGAWTAAPRLRLVCYAGGGTSPALPVADPGLPVYPSPTLTLPS
jgi:AraC-like DNA-binding protein